MKIQLLSLILIILCVLPASGPASDADGAPESPVTAAPKELQALQAEYQQRILKARKPSDDWYRTQLRTLLEQYKRTGKIDASLIVQAALENPDPSTAPPMNSASPSDLVGLHRTYVIDANRRTQPVEGWYKQQLEILERRFLQKGDLVAAQAVRAAAGRNTAAETGGATSPLAAQWLVPYGGTFKGDMRAAVLTGPGTGHKDIRMAMAFLQLELERDFRIAGRIRITGNGGGMAVGRDERNCLTIYWSRGTSWIVHHDGPDRKVVEQPALAWASETWQKFELLRTENDMFVKLDKTTVSVKVPKGMGKCNFGLLTLYTPASVEIKDVTVDTARTETKP